MCVGGDVRQPQAPTRLVEHDVTDLRAQRGQELGVARLSEHTERSEVEDCVEVLHVSQLVTGLQTLQILHLQASRVITGTVSDSKGTSGTSRMR